MPTVSRRSEFPSASRSRPSTYPFRTKTKATETGTHTYRYLCRASSSERIRGPITYYAAPAPLTECGETGDEECWHDDDDDVGRKVKKMARAEEEGEENRKTKEREGKRRETESKGKEENTAPNTHARARIQSACTFSTHEKKLAQR